MRIFLSINTIGRLIFIVPIVSSIFGLRKVVSKLKFLLTVGEPAHIFGYLVKSLLKHHSLSDDQHHVCTNEELSCNGSVKPLISLVCTAQEMALVHENAAPDLDRNVAYNQDTLEP